MRGFKLIAITDKGRDAIEKQNIPDLRMDVVVESLYPYTLSFSYKEDLFKNEKQRRRFFKRVDIIRGLVYAELKRLMSKKYGCELELDYTIEAIR